MTAHVCADCGLLHDMPDTGSGPDPAVEIARINAERDVAVAKLNARVAREELETEEAVAEIETDASVAAAAVEGQILAAELGGDAPAEEDPEPVVIDAPVIDEEPDEEAPPPADESHAPHERSRKRGIGLWG